MAPFASRRQPGEIRPWPEKRILTDEEVAKFKAAFELAVEGEWPATIRPETSVTPRNTEEGQK
jgi:hypothetical protein